jgi:serine/tyrosine/threonine adenylyltransferase
MLTANKVDFTLAFRRLSDAAGDPAGEAPVRALVEDPAGFDEWATRWRQRLAADPQDVAQRRALMQSVNPAYIPRNHRVEAVIQAAIQNQNFAPFEELLAVLARPFDQRPEFSRGRTAGHQTWRDQCRRTPSQSRNARTAKARGCSRTVTRK